MELTKKYESITHISIISWNFYFHTCKCSTVCVCILSVYWVILKYVFLTVVPVSEVWTTLHGVPSPLIQIFSPLPFSFFPSPSRIPFLIPPSFLYPLTLPSPLPFCLLSSPRCPSPSPSTLHHSTFSWSLILLSLLYVTKSPIPEVMYYGTKQPILKIIAFVLPSSGGILKYCERKELEELYGIKLFLLWLLLGFPSWFRVVREFSDYALLKWNSNVNSEPNLSPFLRSIPSTHLSCFPSCTFVCDFCLVEMKCYFLCIFA